MSAPKWPVLDKCLEGLRERCVWWISPSLDEKLVSLKSSIIACIMSCLEAVSCVRTAASCGKWCGWVRISDVNELHSVLCPYPSLCACLHVSGANKNVAVLPRGAMTNWRARGYQDRSKAGSLCPAQRRSGDFRSASRTTPV